MAGKQPQIPESLRQLTPLIASSPGFREVIAELRSGNSASIDGAWGSACALTAAAISENLPESHLLIVVPGVRDVEEFADQISEFIESDRTLKVFPAWETLPEEHDITDSVFAARLSTIRWLSEVKSDQGNGSETSDPWSFSFDTSTALSRAEPSSSSGRGKVVRGSLVVTSLPALIQPVPSREELNQSTRRITAGEEIQLESFLDWLIERSFERVSAVELPGEFCVHGGILDIFAPTETDPIRIELFGDEVESIRQFDVETQRRLNDLESVSITATQPVRTQKSGGPGDSLKPHAAIANATESLLDSLPQNTIVVLTDMAQAVSEGRLYLQRLSNPIGMFGVDATMARLLEFPSVSIDALAADGFEKACHLTIETVDRYTGHGREALEQLAESLSADDFALLACHNDGEKKRLGELLQEMDQADGTDLQAQVLLCTGRIQRGFRFVERRLVVLSDNELFARSQARSVRQRRRTADSRAIDTFLDLRDGDLVVHVTQGIARYRGMALMDNNGEQEEHLLLEFRDAVMVYVPASLIHLVQKYIGPAKTTPELSRFGSVSWEKKKSKVAEAVTDMAADMLRLQAERNSKPGLQCQPDSLLQQEFEQAFPFTETPDQATAIIDLKEDMQRSRPMDRLICGDVGFGKTEVAMRAVFKAVDNGRQVAVLVPTTVLAEQHFRTFRDRMAEFPVNIEMLSRFRTPSEQKQILEALAEGKIDVVIGTHRLVSRDVKFRNLGLLVIDEEQKFGVKVKEQLKHLRLEVDILTLTATPIPRTLHMSLLGIRDISSLTTPPRDRMPIETRVGRFDESLVRSSIIRELNRGGQVYFVHNRVYDIELIAARLRQIVPEATVTIAHGQMSADELELAMMEFVTGKADILLATTIIESGLDIPNANTMIIHQADIYGLADLHQLRGRVGRDRHRAYCYLMLEEGRIVTTTAMRRLKAIEEYSELGAGFRIAMRDLEIRGAGNILGTEQSGNIAAVGYELYCQLLENAVRNLKNQPLRYQSHVRIELPVSVYIPDRYVSEQKLKIEIYRRLSQTNSLQKLADLEEELRDRFGPIPTPTRRMLRLRELNLRALSWKIENIHLEDGFAVLRYRDGKLIRMLSFLHKGHLRIVDQHDAYWPLDAKEDDGAAVMDELIAAFSEAEPPMPDTE
ncbi:MAG: transcription-repair coupling factor [Planctomycetaceae bacterium]|nr:transcription-repair coupling factor [Planctomycetaceae bacterium]